MAVQSNGEQSARLLEAIDTVLAECGRSPAGRRPTRPPARRPWAGPRWWTDERADANEPAGAGAQSELGHGSEHRTA